MSGSRVGSSFFGLQCALHRPLNYFIGLGPFDYDSGAHCVELGFYGVCEHVMGLNSLPHNSADPGLPIHIY